MVEEGSHFNMARILGNVASIVRRRREGSSDVENAESEDQAALKDLAIEVEQARRDWHAAKAYFEVVSDPELVDHAIHLVLATEKRYTYLLRVAKETYARVHEA